MRYFLVFPKASTKAYNLCVICEKDGKRIGKMVIYMIQYALETAGVYTCYKIPLRQFQQQL